MSLNESHTDDNIEGASVCIYVTVHHSINKNAKKIGAEENERGHTHCAAETTEQKEQRLNKRRSQDRARRAASACSFPADTRTERNQVKADKESTTRETWC